MKNLPSGTPYYIRTQNENIDIAWSQKNRNNQEGQNNPNRPTLTHWHGDTDPITLIHSHTADPKLDWTTMNNGQTHIKRYNSVSLSFLLKRQLVQQRIPEKNIVLSRQTNLSVENI